MSAVEQAFSSTGILAKQIKGFSPRQAQLDMALAIEKAIERKTTLIAEAGTGTGKTFAYLLPALISGKKVIVSTGTKNLQEQLFHKDLPIVKKALGLPLNMALLKGRANYLCHYRLAQYQQSRGQLDAATLADIVKVKQWVITTRTGDIGELDTIAEDSAVFPVITSTADNCLGRDCPNFSECYLVQARQKAIEADIVVVNHHLYFADMALKDTGFGELIPKADVVIFDEAHQVSDIASEYFGESFSTRQLTDLCNDVNQLFRTSFTDVKQLGKAADKLLRNAQEFRLVFPQDPSRGNWRETSQSLRVKKVYQALIQDLDFLYQVLKINVGRDEALDNCFDRAVTMLTKADIVNDVDSFGNSLWFETTRRHIVLHQTPLSIADKFSQVIEKSEAAWVFTSATLAVNDSFDHFAVPLGLSLEHTLLVDSPFDYPEQSQLVVPRYLPAANDINRPKALAELAIPLIQASQGACFMLFTSYRMMNLVAEILAERIDNTLLVQGQMAKSMMLNSFVEQDDAVLLATASFWEGIDVRGKQLTCVIIDKLPFASPDEPLLQARSEDIKRQQGDPFYQLQLPQAVIALKQGVGRLVRDVCDQGVMVICDDRLVNRPYGQVFLNSLPDMKRTRDVGVAQQFLTQIHN